MKKLFIIFLGIVISAFGIFNPVYAETETLKYWLCKNNIAEAEVTNFDDIFFVNIKLNQLGTDKLKTITAQNIGKKLVILFKNEVVTVAIIKAEINSGIIRSFQMTEAEAKKLKQQLLNSTDPPCGQSE